MIPAAYTGKANPRPANDRDDAKVAHLICQLQPTASELLLHTSPRPVLQALYDIAKDVAERGRGRL